MKMIDHKLLIQTHTYTQLKKTNTKNAQIQTRPIHGGLIGILMYLFHIAFKSELHTLSSHLKSPDP